MYITVARCGIQQKLHDKHFDILVSFLVRFISSYEPLLETKSVFHKIN